MSIFNSLNIARSGLFASQKAIELAGHNISNVNTEGYSRQRLETSANPSIGYQGASSGGGVNLESVTQLRNEYLEAQFRKESSIFEELVTKSDGLKYIEGIIGEPSDHGINAAMSDLFNSIEELSYNAEDSTLREIVVQNAVKLTDTFNSVSFGLLDYQNDLNSDIGISVNEVNMLGEQIVNYNKTIREYENQGRQANDLRDKRNNLVEQLAKIVPVNVEEDKDNRFSVKISGIYLVDQYELNPMVFKPSEEENKFTKQAINKVYWSGSEKEVNIRGGKLKGLLDIRDGSSKDNQGVAYYIGKIDSLAKSIVEEFNDVHQEGWTLPTSIEDGSATSRKGINFFDTAGLNARNIAVDEELLKTGYNIAASGEEIEGNINWGDNRNLIELIKKRDGGTISLGVGEDAENIGSFGEYLQGIVGDLAITTNYFTSRSESQKELTNHIENQKLSISEVSIDEEMMSLIQYQHSYSAAAKLVSVVDEMLMTLMNMK